MYILQARGSGYYVSLERILHPGNDSERDFPVAFAWAAEKAEAVRFPTKYHARAIAKALPNGAKIIRVRP